MQTLGNMAMYIFLIHFVLIQHFYTIINEKWGWNFISVYVYSGIVLLVTFSISWILYKKPFMKRGEK